MRQTLSNVLDNVYKTNIVKCIRQTLYIRQTLSNVLDNVYKTNIVKCIRQRI